ncbi:hypothetical protein G9A89_020873 [Geosiphon pyriformis]|nr:hypothetical protein G9A89_020873 [Geosiphon pyriformis]
MMNLKFSDAAAALFTSPLPEGLKKNQLDYNITFQFVVSKVQELVSPVYSPLFATGQDTFWQLVFGPPNETDSDFCDLFLTAIPSAEESLSVSNWEKRGKLTAQVYLMNHATQVSIVRKEFRTNGYSVNGTWLGFKKLWKKVQLEGDKIIIGVQFKDTPDAIEQKSILNLPWNHIPQNLIDVWEEHLTNAQTADVKFSIEGKTIYGHSDILAKRSRYFWDLLRPVVHHDQNDEDDVLSVSKLVINENTEILSSPNNPQFIEITDYDFATFNEFIRFIYTDQVSFENATPLSLYEIAEKYNLADLSNRAKVEICQMVTLENATPLLFERAYKYLELKNYLVKFIVENFKDIRETKEFKAILGNSAEYPKFAELMAEIFGMLGPSDRP